MNYNDMEDQRYNDFNNEVVLPTSKTIGRVVGAAGGVLAGGKLAEKMFDVYPSTGKTVNQRLVNMLTSRAIGGVSGALIGGRLADLATRQILDENKTFRNAKRVLGESTVRSIGNQVRKNPPEYRPHGLDRALELAAAGAGATGGALAGGLIGNYLSRNTGLSDHTRSILAAVGAAAGGYGSYRYIKNRRDKAYVLQNILRNRTR